MSRKPANLLNYLAVGRPDNVYLLHLILTTKKFSIRDRKPVLVPLCYTADDCHRTGIRIETQREIDRLPHAQRTDHTRNAGEDLRHFLAANIRKDDRNPRKHLVTVPHHELKHWKCRGHHNIKLYPRVAASKSLRQALLVNRFIESRVLHRCVIEVDLPRHASPHRRLHQSPGLGEIGPVVQNKHVLRRLFRRSRLDQNAQDKCNHHKPQTSTLPGRTTPHSPRIPLFPTTDGPPR